MSTFDGGFLAPSALEYLPVVQEACGKDAESDIPGAIRGHVGGDFPSSRPLTRSPCSIPRLVSLQPRRGEFRPPSLADPHPSRQRVDAGDDFGASGEYLRVGARASFDGGSSGKRLKALKRAPGRGGGGFRAMGLCFSQHIENHLERLLAPQSTVQTTRADAPGACTPDGKNSGFINAFLLPFCCSRLCGDCWRRQKLLTAAAPAMGRYRRGCTRAAGAPGSGIPSRLAGGCRRCTLSRPSPPYARAGWRGPWWVRSLT